MTASKSPDEGTPMFNDARTHYDGCEDAHHDCCLVKLKAERQRCEALSEQVDNLSGNAVLLVTDCAREMQRAEQAESRAASATALLQLMVDHEPRTTEAKKLARAFLAASGEAK